MEPSSVFPNAYVVLQYGGDAFDPLNSTNELSLILAKKAAGNITYGFDQEQKTGNRVDALIHG